MRKYSITCDQCERDIAISGNSIDYRLALRNERIPSRGGAVTDRMAYPILDRDYDFCSLPCFCQWAGEQLRVS